MSWVPTRLLVFALIAALLAQVLSLGPITPATGAQADETVTLSPRGDAAQSGMMLGEGPTSQPGVRWDAQTGQGIPNKMAIRGELLYFTTGAPGVVGAIDRTTGEIVWKVEYGEEDHPRAPEIAGDLVVVSVGFASANDAVIAFDAATGTERWRVEVNNPAAVTHFEGTIYVPTEWTATEEDAVAGLLALDAATGTERWTFTDADTMYFSSVAISEGIVVATAYSLPDDGVGAFAFNAGTGDILWTFSETNRVNRRPAVIANGIVLIHALPNVWAVDLQTGATLWNVKGASSGGGIAASPDTAYIGFRDEVRAVNLQDGTMLWSSPVTGIASAPTIAGGILYTGVWRAGDDPGPHWLHAFDAATGAEIWSMELDHYITVNHPLAVDGVLYVDANKSIVAFGDASQESGTTSEPDAVSGEYTSPEFGHTITWSSPWQHSQPQSSSEAGQDIVTLVSGEASLSVRASADASSPQQFIEFYDSAVQSRQDAEVAMSVDGPDFGRAVVRYSMDGTSYIEYAEVRTLPGGGILVTLLNAPADMFPVAHQSTQRLVSIDHQPPFRAAPLISGG